MKPGCFHPGVAAQIRASDALKLELNELGAHAGTLIVHEQRAWASITFSGIRHRMVYAFDRDSAVAHGEALIERLPEHEFTIPHQLVVDAAIVEVDHRLAEPERLVVTLELLLLDKG